MTLILSIGCRKGGVGKTALCASLASHYTEQNKKVLITGHTGFKGSWLSAWLTLLGAQVTGISLNVPTSPAHFLTSEIAKKINDVRQNIVFFDKVQAIITELQPDYVFHLDYDVLILKF